MVKTYLLSLSFSALCVTFAQDSIHLVVYPCSEDAIPQQQWTVNVGDNYNTIQLKDTAYCLDCNGCQSGVSPWTWDCDPNANSNTNSNQWWSLIDSSNQPITNLSDSNFEIQSYHSSTNCLTAVDYTTIFANFEMKQCNQNKKQLFKYNENTNQIMLFANESLCLTQNYNIQSAANCSVAPYSTYPYCDQALPIPTRVKDLVSRMTITEKVNNLENTNDGVPRLGVPPNQFSEALHGVLVGCGESYNGNTGCPTSFPHALLLSATFNRTLWKQVGTIISTEARGLHNQNIAGLYFWAPDINLFRDPRWGRGQEVPGEDPFLTSQYVMEYSHNMQFSVDSTYLKVVSTAKHYCDYDQEGNYGVDRGSFDANVTEQDQVEYYWPAWRSAIQSGNVQSIMCSYNAVNGVPSCGNDYFMNEIARNEWGFDGYFVSDCGAISDGAFTNYIQNTYTNSSANQLNYIQAKVAIEAGCDVECGSFYGSYLEAAYNASYVSEETIDIAVARLFTRMFELGIMDNKEDDYWDTLGKENVDTNKHRFVAFDAARQGIVLLKNDNNLLPLSATSNNNDIKKSSKRKNKKSSISSIALIGPHANATQNMLSNYHGTNTLVNSHSPLQAITSKLASVNSGITVNYAIGCETMNCSTTNGFAAALTAAEASDISIVFLGLCPGGTPHCNGLALEEEGHDRVNISFPGHQLDLLKTIYNVSKENTILVLINGGIIDITWPKNNIGSIIESFYPGELGGDALYDIIFGNVSPAGKLPVTIYDSSLMKNRPTIMDMNLRNNGGITYRYYSGVPLYEFGYGLSYTNFTYKWMNNTLMKHNDKYSNKKRISTSEMAQVYFENKKNGIFYASGASFYVTVTNIGNMASDCVVLGFVSSDHDDAPLNKKLFDFQRVFLNVGQSVNVTLSVSPETISLVDKHGRERILPGKYKIIIGENNNNDNFVIGEIDMYGNEQILFDLTKVKERWNQKHDGKIQSLKIK